MLFHGACAATWLAEHEGFRPEHEHAASCDPAAAALPSVFVPHPAASAVPPDRLRGGRPPALAQLGAPLSKALRDGRRLRLPR
eukprot:SAG11_NODE_9762_length_882_cov_1.831418_1_plen_82_part_01